MFRWGSDGLARNTLWALAGQGSRVLVQGAYFVLVARLLGADGYGAFAAATALFSIFAPFANFGAGNLLIKRVATAPDDFSAAWGSALSTTATYGTALTVAVAIVARLVLPVTVPTSLILAVAISDLLFARIAELTSQAFQGVERMGRTVYLQVLLNVARLIGIGTLGMVVRSPTPSLWGWFYLAGAVATAAYGLLVVKRELGRARFAGLAGWSELREGLYFSTIISAHTINNDIDKTLLARFSTLDATGIYASAYRIMDVAFTPIRSLLYSSYARFFKHGADGLAGTLAFVKRLLPVALAVSVGIFCALLVGSPLIPHILGPQFATTAITVRWLAIIPVFKTLHHLAGDALSGAGYQGRRSFVQVLVAGANVALNLVLIPRFSWKGALVTSIICDGLLACALWAVVWATRRQTKEELRPCPA
ncbi:oligosaccharide flippase family protein [Aggregicoccus sp. 17bor-14]|uniref:oligosaccharide flippase family protein n=1 Tax=Myxococcaceae TaxID=31 RepID=UPI00129CD7FA|nr:MULTISPECIES: oligosaccharide flippase family protein [Myxococcaceae]MBF5042763.1 oligosaccharide flippase family protein [Simulacricoccus sp. 17bor-14]MRI88531.1 oligosaccharide flippase family protein [Aggregicoccus sp. 17bor-14]